MVQERSEWEVEGKGNTEWDIESGRVEEVEDKRFLIAFQSWLKEADDAVRRFLTIMVPETEDGKVEDENKHRIGGRG